MTHLYPGIGDRVRLIEMPNDPAPIPPDTLGTVNYVSPGPGQIGVKWDNGRTLFLVAGVDLYEVVSPHRVVLIEDNTYARYDLLIEATDPDQAAGIAREGIVNGKFDHSGTLHQRDDALPYVTDVIDAAGEECAFSDEHGFDGVVTPDLLKVRNAATAAIETIDAFDLVCAKAEHTDVGQAWEILYSLRASLHATLSVDVRNMLDKALAEEKAAIEQPEDLRKIVFDNLNNAVDNGYYEPVDSLTADEIVVELGAFAEDCQDREAAELLPHVEEWIATRKKAAA